MCGGGSYMRQTSADSHLPFAWNNNMTVSESYPV